MENFLRSLTRKARALAARKPVDLNLIVNTIHHGCMGLPQELVDYTMEMLHDDIQALKACSLTCKAMFVSTRHLVHQTLYLTTRNTESTLTQEKNSRNRRRDSRDFSRYLRFLSEMGERDLLRYPRQVHISTYHTFSPKLLQPYLHLFQSLDQVHTLTIERDKATVWIPHHKAYFAHFYPTLTSLTIRFPVDPYRHILQFALQFPNLENLCIETYLGPAGPNLVAPAIIEKYPPLSGCLRLVGTDTVLMWSDSFAKECARGVNFRSVELEDFSKQNPQRILNACARTLENFAVGFSEARFSAVLRRLVFTETTVLRRFTFSLPFDDLRKFKCGILIAPLSTIKSPFFCEFALGLNDLPDDFSWPSSAHWGRWEKLNELLEERFAARDNFKFIIKTGKLRDRETFKIQARETFPLWAKRGCLHFEMPQTVDSCKRWTLPFSPGNPTLCASLTPIATGAR